MGLPIPGIFYGGEMHQFESFNLEVTSKCPLKCPQCYCTLEGGKNLPLQTAIRMIREGAQLGAKHVEISGGETLCYPWLTDIIREARKNGIVPNIAISGWGFDQLVLEKLIDAGIGGIFVSINAPTAEQNALTRDGFFFAKHALEVLADSKCQDFYINWVMHHETADTLLDMIELVQPYSPKGIVIMAPKPDAEHKLNSFPTKNQMESVVRIIKENKSRVGLYVESCFSPLLALLGRNRVWGNLNRGLSKGCSAGLLSISVSVDGMFSPCRHLDYYESFERMEDYWENSTILNRIRKLDNSDCAPCNTCTLNLYCRNCLAINSKLYNCLDHGFQSCPLKMIGL